MDRESKGNQLEMVVPAGTRTAGLSTSESLVNFENSPDFNCANSASFLRDDAPLFVRELVGGARALIASGRPVWVDEADYPALSSRRWFIRSGYVLTKVGRKDVRLHRLLLNPAPGQVIDHIDGDPTNNRRSNLRVCTPAENVKNRRKTQRPTSSRFKGVWFAKDAAHTERPWRAQCRVKGKVTYLGSFATEIEAALAYDACALREYGEFARLNFPDAHHPLAKRGARS